jgi:hypothetical protein
VLRGIDLDLPARALVRVEGTNGSGRPRTAYVPERFPAALPFTAAGYLTHLGRIHGLGRSAARARSAEWLARFGAAGARDELDRAVVGVRPAPGYGSWRRDRPARPCPTHCRARPRTSRDRTAARS